MEICGAPKCWKWTSNVENFTRFYADQVNNSWVIFKRIMIPLPAVSSIAKRTLSVREVWGSITGPVKSTQRRQRLATVVTFLRSCVAQALSRGDGPRSSLHASA